MSFVPLALVLTWPFPPLVPWRAAPFPAAAAISGIPSASSTAPPKLPVQLGIQPQPPQPLPRTQQSSSWWAGSLNGVLLKSRVCVLRTGAHTSFTLPQQASSNLSPVLSHNGPSSTTSTQHHNLATWKRRRSMQHSWTVKSKR